MSDEAFERSRIAYLDGELREELELRAEKAEARVAELEAVLSRIQSWDMLNPAATGTDFPWLKKLVNDALSVDSVGTTNRVKSADIPVTVRRGIALEGEDDGDEEKVSDTEAGAARPDQRGSGDLRGAGSDERARAGDGREAAHDVAGGPGPRVARTSEPVTKSQCPRCAGSGDAPEAFNEECPECDGEGAVAVSEDPAEPGITPKESSDRVRRNLDRGIAPKPFVHVPRTNEPCSFTFDPRSLGEMAAAGAYPYGARGLVRCALPAGHDGRHVVARPNDATPTCFRGGPDDGRRCSREYGHPGDHTFDVPRSGQPTPKWRVLVNEEGEPYAVENGTSRRGVDTSGRVEPKRDRTDYAVPDTGTGRFQAGYDAGYLAAVESGNCCGRTGDQTDYTLPDERKFSYANRDKTCADIAEGWDGLEDADPDSLRAALREAFDSGTRCPRSETPVLSALKQAEEALKAWKVIAHFIGWLNPPTDADWSKVIIQGEAALAKLAMVTGSGAT